jgi:hypothetical protein
MPTTQILNPFAWGRFLKDVKKGEKDRKREKEAEDD